MQRLIITTSLCLAAIPQICAAVEAGDTQILICDNSLRRDWPSVISIPILPQETYESSVDFLESLPEIPLTANQCHEAQPGAVMAPPSSYG